MAQQGGFYTQHPHPEVVAQQPVFAPKGPSQFNFNSHPVQDLQQQYSKYNYRPQRLPRKMGMRPVVAYNSINPAHTVGSRGGGSSGAPPETKAPSDHVRGRNKQDAPEAGASDADGWGSISTTKGDQDGEAK